jgi:hypothetical protein
MGKEHSWLIAVHIINETRFHVGPSQGYMIMQNESFKLTDIRILLQESIAYITAEKCANCVRCHRFCDTDKSIETINSVVSVGNYDSTSDSE